MFDLRSWLRRAPKPASLRIHTADGEERVINLGDKRFKWNAAEETVRAAGAVRIEALDKDGQILRATRLSEGESEAASDEDAADKYIDRTIARERKELGAVLDRYGARLNEAFQEGAKAAATTQDKLVDLVEVLTGHLSLAITNLHNVSVNLANVVQAAADGEGGGDKNGALVGALLAKALGGAPATAADSGARKKGAQNP